MRLPTAELGLGRGTQRAHRAPSLWRAIQKSKGALSATAIEHRDAEPEPVEAPLDNSRSLFANARQQVRVAGSLLYAAPRNTARVVNLLTGDMVTRVSIVERFQPFGDGDRFYCGCNVMSSPLWADKSRAILPSH